jgi:hypothetical protein
VRTLIVLLLVSIFSVDYLAVKLEVVSRYSVLIVEALSLVIAILVVWRAVSLRRWEQPRHYVWLMLAFVLSAMIALVAEAVDPGPVLSGIRTYFKFLPVFFLGAVYRVSEKDMKLFLGVFLFISVLQVPVAFYQRFVQFAHRMHTGDPITGTVVSSNTLTMILCIAIAVVITLYVYKKLTLPVTMILFGFLAAPTAINETKATLVLLPVATIAPFIFASGIEKKWRKALPILGICVVGMIGFVVVYDTLIASRWGGYTVGEFIARGNWEWYLYRGASTSHSPDVIGRLDSILLPIQIMSENWMQLLFGLGIGNVSPAFLPGMEGAYHEQYREFGFGMTAAGNLIWETGLIGLTVYLLFFYFVLRDAWRFSKSSEPHSWIGAWWATTTIIMTFGLVYVAFIELNEISYMLYLWSGLIAGQYWHARNVDESKAAESVPRLQLAGS